MDWMYISFCREIEELGPERKANEFPTLVTSCLVLHWWLKCHFMIIVHSYESVITRFQVCIEYRRVAAWSQTTIPWCNKQKCLCITWKHALYYEHACPYTTGKHALISQQYAIVCSTASTHSFMTLVCSNRHKQDKDIVVCDTGGMLFVTTWCTMHKWLNATTELWRKILWQSMI